MPDSEYINENYSTTKLLNKEKPIIENSPKDKFESILFLPKTVDRKGESGLRTKGYFKKSYEEKPLVSIITVVFNGEKYLEETIQSVINQSYDNVEYIIIDGGSTDGTVDIIKKYEEYITYWVSEQDEGIYNAMNKGIEVAKGEGIFFLNAGDYFVGNVLSNSIKIPCFLNVKYHNVFDTLVDIKIKNYKMGLPNCHQGIVFENKNIKYDLTYKIASDYEFYLSHGYTKLPYEETEGYIYYDNEGFSKINTAKRDDEIKYIIHKYFGVRYALWFDVKVKIKNLIKKMIG